MSDKRSSFPIRGIVRNKPQQQSQDGDCEEIINLRYEDGAWHGVNEKLAVRHTILTERYYTHISHPDMLPTASYIGLSEADNAIYLIVASALSQSTETLLVSLETGELFVRFAWMNTYLLVMTDRNVYALYYNQDTDALSLLPDLEMPRVAVGETDSSIHVSKSSPTNLPENIDFVSQVYFDSFFSEFIELLNERRQNGYFFGNMSFYLAYKMFDGSYIKHFGPFVWNVAWDETDYPQLYRSFHDANYAIWTFKARLNYPCVMYQYHNADALTAWQQAGLIQSLCIFASSDMSSINVYESDITKYSFLSTPHIYRPPFDSQKYKGAPDVANHYLVKELPISELIDRVGLGSVIYEIIILDRGQLAAIETNENLPIDNFTSHKLSAKQSYLYNSRLHLGDITILPAKMPLPFCNIFYDSAADDYITQCSENATLYASYFGTNYSIVRLDDTVTLLNGGIDLYLYAEIKDNGETYQLFRKLNSNEVSLFSRFDDPVTYYFVALKPFASYPDIRASRWMLLVNMPAVDSHLRICMPEVGVSDGIFDLKKRTFSNTAIYNGSLQTTNLETYLPIYVKIPVTTTDYNKLVAFDSPLTYSKQWENGNRVQVSWVNNPFYYPAKYSYSIGNPDYTIRAMIVAQEPMTEMQFGQFPLYVFTTGGIFALEYAGGGETLYSRITEFLSDIINAGAIPVSLAGGAIVYQEENAVKVLVGRQSKDISRQMLAFTKNGLLNKSEFINMLSDDTVSALRGKVDDETMSKSVVQFLTNSTIGYDSRTLEVLFSCGVLPETFSGETNYTLVYQLSSGAWYKRTDVFDGYIRLTGGDIGMVRSTVNVLYEVLLYQLKSEVQIEYGEESGLSHPWAFLQTRPFRLESPFYKKINDLILNMEAYNIDDNTSTSFTKSVYGYLYDHYAVRGNLAPVGYHVLTQEDADFINTVYNATQLREAGTAHWAYGNTGTNESGASFYGAGFRGGQPSTPTFAEYLTEACTWLYDNGVTGNGKSMCMYLDYEDTEYTDFEKESGLSVRMAMDIPSLYSPGMFLTDADGNVYDLVQINLADGKSIVITKQNWACTKYADGTPINYSQTDVNWTDGNQYGKYCCYDDVYVADLPPVITKEAATWSPHYFQMEISCMIDPKNLATTAYVEWGSTTAYGNTITLDAISAGITEATLRAELVEKIIPGSYHYRIVATNSSGTTTGPDNAFEIYTGTTRARGFYTLSSLMTGGTVYIDPDAIINGDGTLLSPYNVYPSKLGTSVIYAQKAGTTAVFYGAFPEITGNCRITTYGDGERAKISCTSVGNASDFIFMQLSGYLVELVSLDISGADATGNGIMIANCAGSTLRDCIISGFNVQVWGVGAGRLGLTPWSGLNIIYNTFFGAGSYAIKIMEISELAIAHNYIHDSAGVKLSTISSDLVASVNNNTIDASAAIVPVTDASEVIAGLYATGYTKLTVISNIIKGNNNAGNLIDAIMVYNGVTTRVFGNLLLSANNAIKVDSTYNISVAYNILTSCNKGVMASGISDVDVNNCILDSYYYIGIEKLTGASIEAKNNAFVSTTGTALQASGSGSTFLSHNHFNGPGALPYGANITTGDPVFASAADLNFYPLAGSALINSGTGVGETIDIDLQPVSNPPSRGIYE